MMETKTEEETEVKDEEKNEYDNFKAKDRYKITREYIGKAFTHLI